MTMSQTNKRSPKFQFRHSVCTVINKKPKYSSIHTHQGYAAYRHNRYVMSPPSATGRRVVINSTLGSGEAWDGGVAMTDVAVAAGCGGDASGALAAAANPE
ncbi:hypothetical protein EVAR_2495_1 [Eumeta japonica]|uniref:Uncharacterized protein n=1 Tax=Eumeta variegata TaxID=151549 RepID=A0A4C1SP66_EUMVA|nr:hypothetical protein EVAR_2495_1 [Eumeta japonica]